MICECRRCRARGERRYVERLADQSLSTALRHAQDSWEERWEAGRRSTTTLKPIDPKIRWSAPVSVSDIKNGHEPDAFKEKGRFRVYRITRDGGELYFGIVYGAGKSVADRIREHLDNTGWTPAQRKLSESKQLAKALEKKRLTTFVRYADIAAPRGYRDDPKYLHAIELLLNNSLRPKIYIPQVLTFEDEEEDDEFAW